MSIFKTKGIILKIDTLLGEGFLYTIFTYDYGIIKANKKYTKQKMREQKMLDIGYIMNFEIYKKPQKDIINIGNIHVIYEFPYEEKVFHDISAYLVFLYVIESNIPIASHCYEIFEICENISKKENIAEIDLILASLKVIHISGNLKIENTNKTVEKIIKFISMNKMQMIWKISGISHEIKKDLQRMILGKGYES